MPSATHSKEHPKKARPLRGKQSPGAPQSPALHPPSSNSSNFKRKMCQGPGRKRLAHPHSPGQSRSVTHVAAPRKPRQPQARVRVKRHASRRRTYRCGPGPLRRRAERCISGRVVFPRRCSCCVCRLVPPRPGAVSGWCPGPRNPELRPGSSWGRWGVWRLALRSHFLSRRSPPGPRARRR